MNFFAILSLNWPLSAQRLQRHRMACRVSFGSSLDTSLIIPSKKFAFANGALFDSMKEDN